MRSQTLLTKAFIVFSFSVAAQNDTLRMRDTATLTEHKVRAYFDDPLLKNATSSIAVLDSTQLSIQQNITMLPVMNSVPGIRMEERSPGSYRLSIRGSLLRSPFGVRNVKIYIDEFAFTDAGGNSYLNLLDLYFIKRVEILKGPDGSLYGANSGGVLRFSNYPDDSTMARLQLLNGNYGLTGIHGKGSYKKGKHLLGVGLGNLSTNGYREHSEMNRLYMQVTERFRYAEYGELRINFLMSDLYYETPGGLTKKQYDEYPAGARPGSSFSPGPVEQKAAVYNRSLFGGVLHELKINQRTRHVLALFGSTADFRNPFISNYETRGESNQGIRTYLEVSSRSTRELRAQATLGYENQYSRYEIRNYGNKGGSKDSLQSSDEIGISQTTLFSKLLLSWKNDLVLELGLSSNYQTYEFQFMYSPGIDYAELKLDPVLMPKAALSWQILKQLAWRVTASKGYSPPTISELRASDQKINKSLRPEWGWNYETGFRIADKKDKFWMDASAFYFRLQNAIVRKTDSLGQEYFVNAGSTKQPGIEAQLSYKLVKDAGPFELLELRYGVTLYRFIFDDYLGFSGNRLTGVPNAVYIGSMYAKFKGGIFLFIQSNATAKIPLNDANSEWADSYYLMHVKAGKEFRLKEMSITITAGIDNADNRKYSLGNDLNAFGGRYYNAAAPRNFYGALSFRF